MEKVKAPTDRAEAIERLGMLKARIAKLSVEHDALESKLRKRLGKFSTEHYNFSVFEVTGKTFDWARAKKLLGAKYDTFWIENIFRSSKLTKRKVVEQE